MATRNNKFQNFQFKLSHIITATNFFLLKCGLKEENYAPSVQKLQRVYCFCFGNAPTDSKKKVFISKRLGKNVFLLFKNHSILTILRWLKLNFN